MNHRLIITVIVLLVGTLAQPVEAQPSKGTPHIGMLRFDDPSDHRSQGLTEAFRRGLSELGYVEGSNIVIDYRYAEGKLDRLPRLAVELISLKPNLVVTQGTPGTLAMSKATSTIPIVVGGAGDLVGAGLVATLARPGGNVTGSTNVDPEISAKRLQLLKTAFPKISRVAVLYHGGAGGDPEELSETQVAAKSLGIELRTYKVNDPGQFLDAYGAMTKESVEVLLIFNGSFTLAHRKQLIELAAKNRFPVIGGEASWAEDGGLLSYGYDREHQWRRAAIFVDKILKGAKPADLPVEQPLRYHLAINLRNAKMLGVNLPESILLGADKLIE